MTKITIIIPVEDFDEASKYYRDVLSFSHQDGLFFLPVETVDVALRLMIIPEEWKINSPPRRHFQIFNYKLEKNFLSYCEKIYKKGALIEMACSTPGGYYARISDPAGNQFEIECDNFEEDDATVDTLTMPFFFRY